MSRATVTEILAGLAVAAVILLAAPGLAAAGLIALIALVLLGAGLLAGRLYRRRRG